MTKKQFPTRNHQGFVGADRQTVAHVGYLPAANEWLTNGHKHKRARAGLVREK